MVGGAAALVAERRQVADLQDGLGAREGVLRLGVRLDALEGVAEHRDQQVDEHQRDREVEGEEEVRERREVELVEDVEVGLAEERREHIARKKSVWPVSTASSSIEPSSR